MTYHPPQYAGLSVEASYRYDERLAILGVAGDPTKAQYNIAFGEALAFDRETVRRRVERSNNLRIVDPLQSATDAQDIGSSGAIPDGV